MQSFEKYEVWIIDNVSDDGTIEYLRTLTSPFNWVSEKDNGVYEAMNKGIDRSKGEWLYFLGSDDEIFEFDTLEKVFKNPFVDFELIVGSVKYDSNNGIPFLKGEDKAIKNSSWSNFLWIQNSIHHQAAFYRNTIFNEFRYATKYKILSDYELNLILFKKGISCYLIDEVIAFCGAHGISKNYNWSLYKEEIDIKTNHSSIVFKPLIFLNSLIKFGLKKVLLLI